MPEITEEVTIERPLEDVFAFISDPDNQTLINSNMLRYTTDGPPEKGRRSSGTTKVAGREIEWTSEITEFDPPRRIEFRSIEAPMGFHLTYELDDVTSHTTRVRFHQEVDSLGGFFGKLSDPLVTRLYAHDVKSNLAHLRELLEDEG